MKTFIKILFVLALFAEVVQAGPTPFYFYSRFSNGAANTNQVLIQAWPEQNNFTIVDQTNIVWGGFIQTNQPDANGYFSNSIYANDYRVFFPALNDGFFVHVLNTTNFESLAIYATNIAAIQSGFAGYAVGTLAGITAAQGFQSASNTDARLVLAVTNLSSRYATNLFLIKELTTLGILTNALVTNADFTISEVIGLAFPVMTNTQPVLDTQLSANVTRTATIGASTILTNGGMIWITTNLPNGIAPNVTLPSGSILTSTSGVAQVISNGTWRAIQLQ